MRLPLVPALLLAACAGSADAGGNQGTALPDDAVVLPAGAIDMATRQCSRGTPAAGERYWRPGPADIAGLEAALPAALAAARQPQDWSAFPQDWRRQYVGIVREGRRYVYGNFYPQRGRSCERLQPLAARADAGLRRRTRLLRRRI